MPRATNDLDVGPLNDDTLRIQDDNTASEIYVDNTDAPNLIRAIAMVAGTAQLPAILDALHRLAGANPAPALAPTNPTTNAPDDDAVARAIAAGADLLDIPDVVTDTPPVATHDNWDWPGTPTPPTTTPNPGPDAPLIDIATGMVLDLDAITERRQNIIATTSAQSLDALDQARAEQSVGHYKTANDAMDAAKAHAARQVVTEQFAARTIINDTVDVLLDVLDETIAVLTEAATAARTRLEGTRR